MLQEMFTIQELKQIARQLRIHIMDMVESSQSGHPGASLSAVEIVTSLYFSELNVKPSQPDWKDRDRFVLSKGHASPVLYAALAECGFYGKEELATFRLLNSRLQGHPDLRKTPGVDMTTGSLGQGFASTIGMALGLRKKGSTARVYALLGDGELNEGIIWEAAMIGAHYQLDNLLAIVDQNGKQGTGLTKDRMDMGDIGRKWDAFGWHVIHVDGHDLDQLLMGYKEAKETKGKPTVIVAKTIKGKGVTFMEAGNEFYGEKVSKEQIQQAKLELQSKGE